MAAVLFKEPTPEVEAWLADRQARGADRFDEVWEGMYVVVPSPGPRHAWLAGQLAALLDRPASRAGLLVGTNTNLGEPGDYRIPDLVVFRELTDAPYLPSAELVVEVVSPGEDPDAKLAFYASRGVREVVTVDSVNGRVRWLTRQQDQWVDTDRSLVLGCAAVEITSRIDWGS